MAVSDALRGHREGRPGSRATLCDRRESELPRVVIAGHLTIDEIRLSRGEALLATTGGAAAYAALGAFLAKGDVTVLARVGDDYPLKSLRWQHPDGGRVHLDAIRVLSGRSIHNVARYSADGSRTFDIEDFDTLVRQSPAAADLDRMRVAGRWVLVTPGTLTQQKDLVEALKAAGALVALDTELHYLTEPDALQRLRELTEVVDCFLPSLEHLQRLFDAGITSTAAEMKASVESFGCALTIVKCGHSGAVVFESHAQGVTVPAVPDLEVEDPTGAGDAFNGGFLAGLAWGERPTAAAITGCVAASFVVQAVGAEIPDVFSNSERAARYQQCSTTGAELTERKHSV